MKLDPTIYRVKEALIRDIDFKEHHYSNYWYIELIANGSEVQGYPSIAFNKENLDEGVNILLDFLNVSSIEEAKSNKKSIYYKCHKCYMNFDIFFLFNPANNKVFSPQIEFMLHEYEEYINDKKSLSEFSLLSDKEILLYGFILDIKDESSESKYLKEWVKANMLQNKLKNTLDNKQDNKPVVKI